MCIRDRPTGASGATGATGATGPSVTGPTGPTAVSYTHLDVYKRQIWSSILFLIITKRNII